MIRFFKRGSPSLVYISNGVMIPGKLSQKLWRLKSSNFLEINNIIRIRNADFENDNETEYYPMKVFKK